MQKQTELREDRERGRRTAKMSPAHCHPIVPRFSLLGCSHMCLYVDLVALEDGRLLEEMQLDGGGEHPLERRLQVREDHVLAVEAANKVAVLVANGGSVAKAGQTK